jgi:outer membrane receptor protein involved in Fe transport
VQIYGRRELGKQRQGNLSEFLENNPTSVTINSAQNNRYQADISFRGFTASPLVGVPQGLSVFQDGVRINEAFGDVVNWDLLAPSAIASLQVIPGSNPLFGLNTLGGALAIYTKSGSAYPGGSLELSGGSFGRRTLQFEQGGVSGPWDYFATANLSKEHGWAQHNPSRVEQFFGKVGYQASGGDRFDVSLTAANNLLEGTQTLPASFLDDRTQAYTYPDINKNQLAMLTVQGSHTLSGETVLGGNAYLRRYRSNNVSSNVNDNFGQVDPVSGAIDDVQALNDQANIDQTSYGLSVQLTMTTPLAGHRNQFVVGVSADAGQARFKQASQPADFNASRGTVPIGDFEPETDAKTLTSNAAVYAMNTFAIDDRWSLTASGRFNDARISIRDQSGVNPDLDGDHRFSGFNPALGITFNPSAGFTAYGSYNEGVRAPTAAELTCADPTAPCKLPNAFLADPPLKKVVAHTLEFGARGKTGDSSWSAAIYRTDLTDDIAFVSSGGAAINAGYFQNVGKTRRQGVELTAATNWGGFGFVARYALIDATFRTGYVESSPANSSADANGDIVVAPGSRIPNIPRQSLRMRISYEANAVSFGANLVANSSIGLRGDENNQDISGPVPGYTVLNLDARWRVTRNLEFFGRVDNVFNRNYSNFGVLGTNVFANPTKTFDPANAIAEPFYGLGAPRGAWIGLRYEWE